MILDLCLKKNSYICIKITIYCDFDTNMEYKKIGEIIKERRKVLNITQPTLALLAGVGVNTLVAIERGNGNAKIQTIISILDTLGLKFDVTLKD